MHLLVHIASCDHYWAGNIDTRDCNPGIPNPGLAASQSRDYKN